MSDGVKSAVGQLAADISEAVIKPISDEVGRALEQGAQSVVGATPNQPDPLEEQKKQQKQMEEQKKKQWALRVIEWNKQLEANQQKLKQEARQKESQKKQEESEKQKVKQFKVMEKQKKAQEMTVAQVAERRTEIKKGVGG